MQSNVRDTGIEALGSTSWGAHFCVFYETEEDLADILVPYLKAGLQNNEFCAVSTAEPLGEAAFTDLMRDNIPDFSHYLDTGHIRILPYSDIYLDKKNFSKKVVINSTDEIYRQKLPLGFDGIRTASNAAWLKEKDWNSFNTYEEELNKIYKNHRILFLCAYRLSQSSTTQLLKIMNNHQLALIRQEGKWLVLKPHINQDKIPELQPDERLSLLQEWFLRSGFEGLKDQDIIELLLSMVMSPGAIGRMAKKILQHFPNFRAFISASQEELQQAGVPQFVILLVKLLYELPAEILKQRIINQSAYNSPEEIMEYLYFSMGNFKEEVFKVLYLDSQNRITDTRDLFHGQIDSAQVHLYTIFKTAIARGSSALVFVHNHPSGDPSPSNSDKKLTRDLVFAGNVTQINVLDHIIIGEDEYFSFAVSGLIDKYKNDFLNLRMRQFVRSK